MDWQAVRSEWESSKITLSALAKKHNLKLGTLKSRKSREGWSRDLTGASSKKDATKSTKVATMNESEIRAGQRVRSGNPNPKNQFSHRNNPKLLHGLRSKFLHGDQVEIMEAMEGTNFADQLWMQIEIKFSAIIRMQKIMWVETDDDHLRVESGNSSNEFGDSTTYKVAFAYERFETYIKAQARAMAEYRNLVKQYIELTDEFDERRLKLEGMQLGIEKTKAEIKRIEGESGDQDDAIDDWVDAVTADE